MESVYEPDAADTQDRFSKQREKKELLLSQEEYIRSANFVFYTEPQAFSSVKVTKGNEEAGHYVTEKGQQEILLQMLQQDILRTEMNRAEHGRADLYEADSRIIDEDDIVLALETAAFVPEQNSPLRRWINGYQGKVSLTRPGGFSYVVEPSVFPNTYQYLLDNGFLA